MTSAHRGVTGRLRRSQAANAVRRQLHKGQPEPRWEGVDTSDQAARALHAWATEARSGGTAADLVVTVGDGGEVQDRLEKMLRRDGQRFRSVRLEDLMSPAFTIEENVSIVLCTYPDARRITDAAAAVSHHSLLADVRFEYASGLDPERSAFARLDEYANTWFVSPVLLDEPSPYEIYSDSLERFEQKCGLRDYLDLYQLLRQIVSRDVPGDVAEFGSYRGHSGYLIARSLQALGSEKGLFMFDTFETFPDEAYGVDRFWSHTHDVDFESVQAKFADFDHVTMVKGDFTATLDSSDLGTVALAYVDCDSYRATRYLIDALLPDRISAGGLLVFEDYGHPALLGNRVAVREGLRKYDDCFQFFSQFSGLYIAVKLP